MASDHDHPENTRPARAGASQECDRADREWLAYARGEAEEGFAELDRGEGILASPAEHMDRIDAAVLARSDRRAGR